MTVLECLRARLKETGLYRLDGTTLVDAELEAYAAGLEPLRRILQELEQERFASTARDWGLSLAEQRLAITVRTEQTEKERRENILVLGKTGPQSFSAACLKLEMAARGACTDIVEAPEETKLYLCFGPEFDSYEKRQSAVREAAALMPAHLKLELDFRALSWDSLDGENKSWNVLDAAGLDWNSLDESKGGLYRLE